MTLPRRVVRPSRILTLATVLAAQSAAASTALAAVPTALAAVPTALAAPAPKPPLSNEARAERLFSSAERKFDSGDYAGACGDFSASLKLGPKLGTLLNLALCHETIGKVVTAWREFAHAAAWAAQNNQRDRLEFAVRHIRDLESKLPRVVLQLPPERAISTITGLDLDGDPLPEDRWYLPLFLDPGEHHLAVTAPGKRRTTIAFRVTSSPSDQLVYIPPLQDEPNLARAAEPTTPPNEPESRTRRTLGWIGLGTGAAGVAVGTTFGVLAMTAAERDPAVKRDATIATIGFLSGAALAGAGAWLLLSSRSGETRTAVSIAPQRSGVGISAATLF